MIYDHLSNIGIYKGLSADINKGLTFLKQAAPDLANGAYQLKPRVKAVVSEYETKVVNEYGYEAHKKYIDIQCTLKGIEQVSCLPTDILTETKPYSEEKDAAFYTANTQPVEMTIGDGYFTIFFPNDGHMPQLCVKESCKVR